MSWGICVGLYCDEFPEQCVYTSLISLKEGTYSWPILPSFALDGFSASTGQLHFAIRLAKMNASYEGRLHVEQIDFQASALSYESCSPRSFETQRLTRKNSVYGDAPQLSYDSKLLRCQNSEHGIRLSCTYKASQYRDEDLAVMVGYLIVETLELEVPRNVITRLIDNRGHKLTCMLKSISTELYLSRPQRIESHSDQRSFEWRAPSDEDNFGMTPRTASRMDYEQMIGETRDINLIKRIDKLNKHGSVLMVQPFVPDNDAYANPYCKLPFFIQGRLIISFYNFRVSPPFGPLRLTHAIPMQQFLQARDSTKLKIALGENFTLEIFYLFHSAHVEIRGVKLTVTQWEQKLTEMKL